MSSDDKPPVKEPIVLDREGRVIHAPESSAQRPDPARDGASVAWGTTASGFRTIGAVPKVLFGVAFLSLFALGLAVAGVAIAAFLIGWVIRMLMGGGARRR
jgi:hypothetical protein